MIEAKIRMPATLLAGAVLVSCGADKDPSWQLDTTVDDAIDDTVSEPTADTPLDTLSDTPPLDALPDAPTDHAEEACAAEEVQAELAIAPVDIIWVVDSSNSMEWEMHTVRDNLNSFSSHIWAAGIEHHVVLIGDASEMMVPPPLGGSPDFLHIDEHVGSEEGLEAIVNHYDDFKDFLRPGAIRHFVAVSDDDSDLESDDFVSIVSGWSDPGFPPTGIQPRGFTFHSIVAFGSVPYIGCITGAKIGRQYIDLTELTFGVKEPVCQTNWTPIFNALETAIGVPSYLPCTYDIPDPPEGETLDPNEVNFEYTPAGGAPLIVPRVDDLASCVESAWYYDEPDDPTQIVLCPDTCETVQSDAGANVSIAFGCTTVII